MAEPATVHVPVLLDEVLEWLAPGPGQLIVDGTLGGGGHTRALAARVRPGGRVLALDRDPAALARVAPSLADLPVDCIHANFADLPEVLAERGRAMVDGVLLDLGLSSDQLADTERGFSFTSSGPLDLRFDAESGSSAAELLARLRPDALADLIYELGEERYSRRIARRIDEARREQPIRTAAQLAEIVRQAVPPAARRLAIHPATRTFQALRIAVNRELESLELALQRIPSCLNPGGRIAVISFHSLEDRRVKLALRADERCEVLTRKPIVASSAEVARNVRARSAKLRVAARRA